MLIAFGLLLSAIGTHAMLRHYLTQQTDVQLNSVADTWSRYSLDDIVTASRFGTTGYVAVYFNSSGQYLYRSGSVTTSDDDETYQALIASAPRLSRTPHTVTTAPDASWRAVVVNAATGGAVLIAMPLTGVQQVVSLYDNIFVAFGILVVIAGGLAAWALAEGLFAPLRRAERQAAEVAGGNYRFRLIGENANTELGRLNISLNRMTDDIEQSFAARQHTIDQMQRFVADASHELRTPLVSVRGYAELYRMGALPDDAAVGQAMERIEKEAVRMSTLVEDMLALARLDDTKPMQAAPIDLRVLAHDAAMDGSARDFDRTIKVIEDPTVYPPAEPTPAVAKAPNRSLRLPSFRPRRKSSTDVATPSSTLSIPFGNITPQVFGEEDKVRQVFTNLLNNALRYTPKGTPIDIRIGANVADHTTFFAIEDHGEGIPPQIRDKIFRRFWRADTSRTRDTGGSGLGLSIVSAIVAAHTGTISVDETPGGGATFRVVMPLYVEPDEAPSDQEELDVGAPQASSAKEASGKPPRRP